MILSEANDKDVWLITPRSQFCGILPLPLPCNTLPDWK